jgi:hypothetical protein
MSDCICQDCGVRFYKRLGEIATCDACIASLEKVDRAISKKQIQQQDIEIHDLRRRLDDVTLRYLDKCQQYERAVERRATANAELAGAIERYEREAMQNIKYREALDKIQDWMDGYAMGGGEGDKTKASMAMLLIQIQAIAKQAREGGDGK